MDDTAEQNTYWVSVWIENDSDYYYGARSCAYDGGEYLREYLLDILQHARKESTPGYVNSHMSSADYATVDWQEISETLLSA